jgi:hypothetical protein
MAISAFDPAGLVAVRMNPPKFVIHQVDPARARRKGVYIAVAWIGTVLLAAALSAVLATRHGDTARLPAGNVAEVDALKSRIAVLERSEQVAKAALVELQNTLRDREEEIAGVRADLAFYGRLVGGARREGLAIHALTLEPVAGSRAWNFRATLTQNFKRGSDTRGRLVLSLSGVSSGALATLGWNELTQQPASAGIEYAFKYFQQVSGTIMVPEGFEPNRVRASADGDGGRAEQEFSWNEAAKAGETVDVRQ